MLKQSDQVAENLSIEKATLNYLPEVIWKPFDKATEKQKEEAQNKLAYMIKIAELNQHGMTIQNAIALVAEREKQSIGSLKRWYYKVKNFERSDWLPLLLDKHGNNRQSA